MLKNPGQILCSVILSGFRLRRDVYTLKIGGFLLGHG
jgi:hypothetical protein